ncbi:hypothetical protein BE221DRAFT_63293 [Ostreococcus tauri]|uniref:Uncharacterized protein n=1 Tax=Ostreococcus tauri TaxID=70448 RepID=A0A1Y5I4D4_OSTTA|nr:hypothetical protein BE221DRAFT_63293 [Ostreococcus tauri]
MSSDDDEPFELRRRSRRSPVLPCSHAHTLPRQKSSKVRARTFFSTCKILWRFTSICKIF